MRELLAAIRSAARELQHDPRSIAILIGIVQELQKKFADPQPACAK